MQERNLRVEYLYRDGANYKRYSDVVIANPSGLSPDAVRAALRERFLEQQCWPDILHFRPETLGWPALYFDDHDPAGDDLDLHELDRILPTDEPATIDFDAGRLMR